ncbi:MAG TPA: hydrolase [Candidatus Marinimicrobia bacterium]|nr:hydrolase [Candidatus Neomarinimicrobiota bacterium]
MIIAVDFDGTIVEHRYPEIGKEKLFAFETLLSLQKQKHKLILWTYRAGKELDEALSFCKENGLTFYAVNANSPGEKYVEGKISRKIYADLYIDDRNIGGFPGWGEIWNMINPDSVKDHSELSRTLRRNKKGGFFSKIFKS